MARLSLPFPVHCSCSHRRLLHEPLVPVDWNAPPSPSLEVSYPQSTLPLPPPTGPVDISSGTNQAHRIKGSAVIVIAVSVMLLGILSFCVFLVYRRLNRRAPESERLVGGGRGPRFEAAPAARQPLAPVALYLGTEAPAVGRGRSREQRPGGGSPYEKLRASARQLPSPELHPLPALHPSARNSESAVASLSSDEYYTPNRSAAGESPSSVTSAVGKDIPVCAVDRRLRSRRLSPRSRLSNSSSSDVKRVVVAQSARPPPPPPPPPPPKPKAAPAVPSLPTEVPVRPSSSRRQWVKPASQADVPVPVAENPSVAKPRLKPLHWDKVRASSDREMVWDQLKSNSFQLDEDMFVMLFCNSANGAGEGLGRRPAALSSRQENHRVLDPKKSQNIAILLRALNVTVEEVTEALLEGDPEGLGTELLETLVKMAPSKEEELRLKDFSGDISKLGSAELFLKAILDIPFAFQRVDAMLYRANFDTEVDYLRKSFKTLEVACDELKGSRLFLKLLEAVLRTGNRMNVGTNRGEAKAFKLDALLKLADVKGVDGKITLLHFVVQEIIRSEGSSFTDKTTENSLSNSSVMHEDGFKKEGLRVVAGLGKEFVNLKLAASMDSSVLSSYVSKLESGLDKIKSVLQLGRVTSQGRFFESMNIFLGEAEKEVARVKAEEKSTFTLVKEITEYFHGNAAKEEAHPFRIFMVVRDFLTMLDNVCREVERMQTTAVVGSARSFRMSTSVSLPVLNRFEKRRDESSGDESSSS